MLYPPTAHFPGGLRMAASIGKLASVAAIFLALSACTQLKQYRTTTVKNPQTHEVKDQICEKRAPNSSGDLCALEHRTYTYEGAEHDYYFATVELDDEGWFWDRRQMELLLRFLYDYQDGAGQPGDFLIFTHAHGWQHNADACDNNVVCFQRLLERLDVSERRFNKTPRKIVGVYIAWRGRSITIPKVSATSFYARKEAGNRVGIGGVTEFLTRLNDLRRFKNPDRLGTKTQLVISGHSFGGQVIYKAVGQILTQNAAAMVKGGDGKAYGYDVARSFGDLVILVNPAFEGSAFESLQAAATNRCYPEVQRPAMIVVTSTADDATRLAFPAGRTLSNLFERTQCPDERKAVLHTVGHLDRYRTHVLKLKGMEPARKQEKERKEGSCGCPYLAPIEEFQMRWQDQEFFQEMQKIEAARAQADGKVYEMGGPEAYPSAAAFTETSYGKDYTGNEMVLDRSPDYAANYPYLVISTNAERFTDFLRRFYFRHLVERLNFPQQCFKNTNPECRVSDVIPCDRSWKPRLEYKCESTGAGRP
jgi:hypothetical protein